MSKLLAAIRFWPYDKIKVQEELTVDLADFAHEKGWDDGWHRLQLVCEL